MLEKDISTEIQKVCSDFELFCNYVVNNKVKLSKTTWYIGKKDCFEINSLLHIKEQYEKATRFQNQYPIIHFFYYVALKCRILDTDHTKNVFIKGKMYKLFEQCSELEKYLLLVVYAIHDMGFIEQGVHVKYDVRRFMDWLWEKSAFAGDEYLLPNREFGWLIYDTSRIIPILEEMCLIKILEKPTLKWGEYQGKLRIRVLPLYNLVAEAYFNISEGMDLLGDEDIQEILEVYIEKSYSDNRCGNIMKFFQPIKPEMVQKAIDLEVKIRDTNVVRVIRMNMSDTLYTLHLMIQEAVQFDNDHLFMFYVGHGLFTQSYTISDAITSGEEMDAEDTALGELELCKGTKFSYLFDFGDMWWFDIKVLDIIDTIVAKPVIIKEVNPAPEQYPFYDW